MNQNIYNFIIAQSIYKPLNALDLKHRTNLLLSRHFKRIYPLMNYLCHRLQKTFGLCSPYTILLHQEIKFLLVFIFNNWFWTRLCIYQVWSYPTIFSGPPRSIFYRQGPESSSHNSGATFSCAKSRQGTPKMHCNNVFFFLLVCSGVMHFIR